MTPEQRLSLAVRFVVSDEDGLSRPCFFSTSLKAGRASPLVRL